MIASLERSSNSEDDNDDPHNEGGGKRLSSPNKNPRNSTSYSLTSDQRHSASYSHSPNKTQRTLPSRGTVHGLFSFSAPSPGAGSGPSANTREESDAWTEGAEMTTSPHQARLLFCPPLLMPLHTSPGSRSPFVHTESTFVSAGSLFPSTGTGSPFVSTHSGSPFASTGTGPEAPVDTAGLYEFGYRHAPLPLSSLSTASSGFVPPLGVIPIPLARNMLELRPLVLEEVQVESEDVELLDREGEEDLCEDWWCE